MNAVTPGVHVETPLGWWLGFGAFVVTMLALDLGIFHRRAHKVSFREAATWVCVWISLALIFNLGIYLGWFGGFPPELRGRMALEFLTAYLIEESLSMDNIFVFVVIFNYFCIPNQYQHKILFYGILGALVFRLVFILVGLELLKHFAWMMYVFGGLLLVTGIRLMIKKEGQIQPEKNPVIRLARRFLPVTHEYHGDKFCVRLDGGRLFATPMLLVLLLVETTDVIFAVDSIPAVIGVTQVPFIVYTSNVFAILGLRALYFVLASVMDMFHYLSVGLSIILIVIGAKMIVQTAFHWHIGPGWSLGIVASILAVSIIASILLPKHPVPGVRQEGDDDRREPPAHS